MFSFVTYTCVSWESLVYFDKC